MHALIAILAAEKKTKNPLIPATNELIWGTVAFLLLLGVLWRAGVFKRISDALRERAERIEGNIEKAEQARADADRLLAEYREKLDEARGEARRIIDEARELAEQVRKDLQRKAQDESNRIIEAARADIRAERARAERELRQTVGLLAVRVAGRVVDSELDEERHLALVDSYIDELIASGNGGASNGNGSGVARQ
ncbi:MAG TPA: F0F1 ATP synthase subunit B [Actinomycetota bacterium]